MPVSKHRPTTMSPGGSTAESSSPLVPEQEEFRQYLRRLAISAVQVLLEQVMREELEQCIGASWGECTRHQPWVPQWLLHARPGDSHRAHRGPEACPETGPEPFIRRCSSAMLAMNPRSPKR